VVDASWRGKNLPLYAYRCTKCGYKFEKIQSFSSKQELECPECHGLLERPLTAPGLKFKGSGWYVNDYGGKSSVVAGETAPSTEKAEAKTPCGGSCGAACPAVAAAAPAVAASSTN
jgi:putative FmdB family regulatory protein